MKTYRGTSFGFGLRLGRILVFDQIDEVAINAFQSTGCVINFFPSPQEYSEIIRKVNPEFLIMRNISGYSHFMTEIWSNSIPVIAVNEDEIFKNDQLILVDFELSKIYVSETDTEVDSFYSMLAENSPAVTPSVRNVSQSKGIKILGEPSSEAEIDLLLKDGAKGIGILKGDMFPVDFLYNSNVERFAKKLKLVSSNFPILLRFFDFVSPYEQKLRFKPNSSLGFRGIRLLEIDPDLFYRFEKLLEFLNIDNVIIILPMVVSSKEIDEFRSRFNNKKFKVGITVETPSAAINFDQITSNIEFVEIGLNDLTQYTMAWDRNVPNANRLPIDQIAPAVARLISKVVVHCDSNNIPYTIGFDLRPSLKLVNQLNMLGVKSISCHTNLVKHWKRLFDES